MRLMTNKNSNEDSINRIIYLMQTDRSEDAPQDAVKWAKNVFRTRAAALEKSFAQKVLAVLQMNLSPDRAAFGERLNKPDAPRQMFLQTGEYAVDLRMEEIAGGWKLYGQVIGDLPEKSFIRFEGKNSNLETKIDEFGEFSVETKVLEEFTLSILQLK